MSVVTFKTSRVSEMFDWREGGYVYLPSWVRTTMDYAGTIQYFILAHNCIYYPEFLSHTFPYPLTLPSHTHSPPPRYER